MCKLIEDELEQGLNERKINEQFLNEYIYKLSLFNPDLHTKITNLCAMSYLLSQKLKLSSEEINQIYMYSSLYYIKDSKVIQMKMASYCKKFDNIRRIQNSGISFYTEDLIELIIMLCDKFLTLYEEQEYDKCMEELKKDEVIPQILVVKLGEVDKYEIEHNLG